MTILAFECANFSTSVAVLLKEEYKIFSGKRKGDRNGEHTHFLFPLIKDLLLKSGVSLVDIEVIATTVGPGSFTGIRTALSSVMGLTLSTRIVPRFLDSFTFVIQSYLMERRKVDETIHVLLESGRTEKFFCSFSSEGTALCHPSLVCEEDLDFDRKSIRIGNGWKINTYMPTSKSLAKLVCISPGFFSERGEPLYYR